MTKIQNPKQLAFDLIWDLFVIWSLTFVISGCYGFSPLTLGIRIICTSEEGCVTHAADC